MKRTIILAAALSLTGTFALAQSASDAVVKDLQAQGYSNIEVQDRGDTVKVEGVKSGEKVEMTIDKSTGEVLKSETQSGGEQASGSDDGAGHDAGDDNGGSDGGDDHGGSDGGDSDGGSDGGGDHGGSGGGEGSGEGSGSDG